MRTEVVAAVLLCVLASCGDDGRSTGTTYIPPGETSAPATAGCIPVG